MCATMQAPQPRITYAAAEARRVSTSQRLIERWIPIVKRRDGWVIQAKAQRRAGPVQRTEDSRIGEQLRGVDGALGGEVSRAIGGRDRSGFVVDHPKTIASGGERGGAGTEDAVSTQRAQPGSGGGPGGESGPGRFGLRFGVRRENPLADGVGSTGEQEICHCIGG